MHEKLSLLLLSCVLLSYITSCPISTPDQGCSGETTPVACPAHAEIKGLTCLLAFIRQTAQKSHAQPVAWVSGDQGDVFLSSHAELSHLALRLVYRKSRQRKAPLCVPSVPTLLIWVKFRRQNLVKSALRHPDHVQITPSLPGRK